MARFAPLCRAGVSEAPAGNHPGSGQTQPASLRRAGPADVAALAAIDGMVNASPWRPGQFEAACDSSPGTRESALVAQHNAQVCGFIVFSQVLDEGCIHNLAIHPLWQRVGLARALVGAALDTMQRDGAGRCLLEVRESNAAARGLYEALGFALDGRRKNYYPAANEREDALLMSIKL